MVIFHSYVKLPEGNQSLSFTPNKLPHLVAWDSGIVFVGNDQSGFYIYIYISTMSAPLDS